MTEAWIHNADPTELWNLGPRLDIDRAWAPRPMEQLYRIPIGVDETGAPVELDFKESALDGMGPHGLVVGGPGSGKPEFLRSIVLGLMATHSPAEVNFVLAGYNGGATFGDFESAPHVFAFVPELESDRIVRLQDSLEAELSRRMEVLSGAGAKNHREYRRMRESDDQRCQEPLPALFVVIDEFSRTLEEKPDFGETLVKLGRMGRSLGVHMLLASYRLMPGDLSSLDGFLSYRVALRTFTADESRMVIGNPDAYDLPSGPGLGYLHCAPAATKKFKAASLPRSDSENDLLTKTLAEMSGKPPAPRQILAPPQEETPSSATELWNLGPKFDVDRAWAPRPIEDLYRIPIGREHAGDPFEIDFKESALGGIGPHGLIVGASGSGRASLLRSIVTGLMATHSPTDVNLALAEYIGGPTFGDFENAPHVSAFASGLQSNPGLVRRLRDSLEVELSRRMELLRVVKAKNFREYHRMQESGDQRCQEPLPALFVVIDEFLRTLDEQPGFVEILVKIGRLGRSLGIHMLLSSYRLSPGDLRSLEPFLSYRVALRTFNADESRMVIGIPEACYIPTGTGRGYLRTHDGIKQFKAASVPYSDSEDGLISTALAAMRDNAAAARQILPRETLRNSAADLWNLGQGFDVDRAWAPRPIEDLYRIPIGVDETGNPVEIDFKEPGLGGIGPHGLIIGATGSGKSELLRTIVLGLMATHPPTDVNFVAADYSGSTTFRQFKNAPHVSAIIPALISEPELLGRFQDSLDGELKRRRDVLSGVGAKNIWDYRQMRESGDQRCQEPLPILFVIIEQFDGMLERHPALLETLAMICRSGRSLGVHLVLSSQTVDDGRFRPLEGKLSYHIALRTFNAADSRAAIGVPDAQDLPPEPGLGYLRTSDGIKQFKAAYVSGDEPETSLLETTLAEMRGKTPAARQIRFPQLKKPSASDAEPLNLGPQFDVDRAWAPRPVEDLYRIPIGVDETGTPVEIDFKETDLGGIGPHGLIIGATGSGKSELLRTIVLGLTATHSPTDVNFVLAEHMGAATFHAFKNAPHVSAIIPSVASEPELLGRLQESLDGEISRRMDVLSGVSAKNILEYRRMRESGDQRCQEPLPTLFVVLDEFSEMLSAQPDFADLLLTICRLGRALGIRLLLASQRLEVQKIRPFEALLSYRISLKTFSAAESRATIGVPDAYNLPPEPGFGLLRTSDGIKQFKTAYVSGGEPETSLLETTLAEMRGKTPAAHQIWLPPLETPPTLDALLPPLQHNDARGYTAVRRPGDRPLQVPMGTIDVPYYRRQDPMVLDLDAHGAIVGRDGSGKSTAMCTLIASLALTNTPREVQFYCVDLGGGSLAAFRDLPHVGSVITDLDVDAVQRTTNELDALLARRQQLFQQLGIGSMAELRERRLRGEPDPDPYGDVFLLIDGWRALDKESVAPAAAVHYLAQRGLPYGVHVFVTAKRWSEIRSGMRNLLQTRIELRLNETDQSQIDPGDAARMPQAQPGRGLHPSKQHFLTSLPRVDGAKLEDLVEADRKAAREKGRWPRPVQEVYRDSHADAVADLVNRVRASWRGYPAPPVQLLPTKLPYRFPPANDPKLIPLGIGEKALQPVHLDFRREPHFYAIGERSSGRTTLLRTIIRGITERYTPQEALIMLVDYRRTLLGFLTTEHMAAYVITPDQLRSHVEDVIPALRKRMPGPHVTQEQVRNRSWWSGPDLFIVIDDYELVAKGGENPLAPLAEFLPMAADLGLHVVLTRDSAGAGRGLYERFFSVLRETNPPALAMSANADEGKLISITPSRTLPPGRGTLVSRLRGRELIQTPLIP
ncbi:FtsK/SpoIIIE domain-containing protein [Saccharopolyspora sp. NPDC050389]|uniref:type VII secretion protein EccC n=1 Tax=Saccharopolyspora sp. NPDC050389 TaxID=3155516 RepID=UPI0033CF7BEB